MELLTKIKPATRKLPVTTKAVAKRRTTARKRQVKRNQAARKLPVRIRPVIRKHKPEINTPSRTLQGKTRPAHRDPEVVTRTRRVRRRKLAANLTWPRKTQASARKTTLPRARTVRPQRKQTQQTRQNYLKSRRL